VRRNRSRARPGLAHGPQSPSWSEQAAARRSVSGPAGAAAAGARSASAIAFRLCPPPPWPSPAWLGGEFGPVAAWPRPRPCDHRLVPHCLVPSLQWPPVMPAGIGPSVAPSRRFSSCPPGLWLWPYSSSGSSGSDITGRLGDGRYPSPAIRWFRAVRVLTGPGTAPWDQMAPLAPPRRIARADRRDHEDGRWRWPRITRAAVPKWCGIHG